MNSRLDSSCCPSLPSDASVADDTESVPASSAIAANVAQQIDLLQGYVGRANEQQSDILAELDNRAASVRSELEAARGCLHAGMTAASDVDSTCSEGLGSAQASIAENLADVITALEEKAKGTSEVIDLIRKISRSVHLLSINASIEAARGGESSKGFAAIAHEIRELAHQTMTYTDVARTRIDLKEIVMSLDSARNTSRSTLDEVGASIVEAAGQVIQTNQAISRRFDSLNENNLTLFELAESSRIVGERFSERNNAAREAARALATALVAGGRRRTESLQTLASELDLDVHKERDRLAEIKARGELRVAVEPSFVGLSFRQSANAKLQGLDVEYAEAFAQWLGVRCSFVEVPWDVITEALFLPSSGQPRADIVVSALPPDSSYDKIAYSDTYTHLEFVLCRRVGDRSIKGLADLEGKSVGIINDPGAYLVLEAAGLRWPANAGKPGGKIKLGSLVAYSDQTRIHDCLADGAVDAFCVDLPIYHWASTAPESPWYGKIETVPGHLGDDLYYYAMAVPATRSALPLLHAANQFIAWFKTRPERRTIEERWQGGVIDGSCHYSKEPGKLLGEPELTAMFACGQ